MTIIIALAHEGGVTIGSDRFSCRGNLVAQHDKQKWSGKNDEHGGPVEWNVSLLMTDGSGWAFALGAMHPASASALSPELVVREGLRAAIYYDLQCGGEPWIKTITKEQP